MVIVSRGHYAFQRRLPCLVALSRARGGIWCRLCTVALMLTLGVWKIYLSVDTKAHAPRVPFHVLEKRRSDRQV